MLKNLKRCIFWVPFTLLNEAWLLSSEVERVLKGTKNPALFRGFLAPKRPRILVLHLSTFAKEPDSRILRTLIRRSSSPIEVHGGLQRPINKMQARLDFEDEREL